ncbi:MAG: phage Gp37/Gp68 family protein [Bacteroidales bacterium]|nr:phage Gp37/Gp68 family protein [Bacteroidales bacterium]
MSKIEWTNRTWNPVTGCDLASRGCENCYAMRITKRLQKIPLTAEKYKKGNEVVMHIDELFRPERWRKPSMVFVCSMSDLFHENVTDVFIREVLYAIKKCPQHTFQILTKRPQRAVEFLRRNNITILPGNVWFGVSAEDQEQAEFRIPYLLKIPAHIRFISAEPLLGSIDLTSFLNPKLNWIIAGGETGPASRPMHPDWVRSLRNQCQQSNTPFFFKSWGEFKPNFQPFHSLQHWVNKAQTWLAGNEWRRDFDKCIDLTGKHLVRGADFQDAEYPVYPMWKTGKKASGNTLDGQTHTEFPSPHAPCPEPTAF